jgi:predicted Zn-ribbon and HTH transcriptional regulator
VNIYRTEIHGHLLEAQIGDLGGEIVLDNGREASSRPFAGLGIGKPHRFEITDEKGATRHVEVRFEDASFSLGLKHRVRVLVDGADRAIMRPHKPAAPQCCHNCGYSLQGLAPQNGEVRCPECGRHTSAAVLGLTDAEARES